MLEYCELNRNENVKGYKYCKKFRQLTNGRILGETDWWILLTKAVLSTYLSQAKEILNLAS